MNRIFYKRLKIAVVATIVIGSYSASFAQKLEEIERRADSLYNTYNFTRAKVLYKNIIKMTEAAGMRSRLEVKAIASENGEAMLQFATSPKVVARRSLNKKDFYLYYPSIGEKGKFITASISKASKDTIYMPDNASTIYFSAKSEKGDWNIYESRLKKDSLWSEPIALGSNVNSSGNELFPFLSPDGKQLYFSSNGHFGVGGYDLYVSEREGDRWGMAQNLGLPYSSPFNDFFFYITPDSRYAAFASDRSRRGGKGERVTAYVIEYEANPSKKEMTPDQAAQVAVLRIKSSEDERDSIANATVNKALEGLNYKGSITQIDSTTRANNENYKRISLQFRELQNKIEALAKKQQKLRGEYGAASTDSLKQKLVASIAETEAQMLVLQENATAVSLQIRRVEENFLTSGVVIPMPEEEEEAATEEVTKPVVANVTDFLTDKANVFSGSGYSFEKPEVRKDLSFRILAKSEMAWLKDIPAEVTYQIRLFSVARKAGIAAFKGISPIFERKGQGKFVYFAGIFPTYKEATAALAKVKKKGFPTATIVSYQKGKAIPLASARKSEATNVSYSVSISAFAASAPEEVLSLLRASGKDIAKVALEEGFKYIVGTFSSQEEANSLALKLKGVSDKKVAVESTAN